MKPRNDVHFREVSMIKCPLQYIEVLFWEFDLRNYVFKKFPISFVLFFDENNIVKLGIDYAVYEEIAATDG